MTTSAINLSEGFYLHDDGHTYPITNMFDCAGEQTDDPDEAFSFVAGEGGFWVSELVGDYETALMN